MALRHGAGQHATRFLFDARPLAGRLYARAAVIKPLVVPFWQTGWFHLLLAGTCGLILLVCVRLSFQLALHAKEQRLLDLERARIARDIHDDFGTRLTRLVLESEVAQSEMAEEPRRANTSRASATGCASAGGNGRGALGGQSPARYRE